MALMPLDIVGLCTLQSWADYRYQPTPVERKNLDDLLQRLRGVEKVLGTGLTVSCGIRPTLLEPDFRMLKARAWTAATAEKWDRAEKAEFSYNAYVGGASKSYHRTGQAADLLLPPGSKLTYSAAIKTLEPHLAALGLRAEKNGEDVGRRWLHLDSGPVPNGGHRVFVP